MYCKNCGRKNEEDSIFCQDCGIKLGTKKNEEKSRESLWKIILIGCMIGCLFCGLMYGVMKIGKYGKEGKAENEPEEGKIERVLASEWAETEDGELIYEIKYEYNKYGEEIKRVAYDAYGNENELFLEYAADVQPFLKDYWRMEIEDGQKATGFFKMEEDYIYNYDQWGYLTRCDFLTDNDLEIYATFYSYTSISVKDKAKQQEKENSEEKNAIDKFKEALGLEPVKNSSSLRDKLMDDVGIINVSGEECYAIWGETGALVWKYVEASFEEEAYIASAFACDVNDVTDDQAEKEWDAIIQTDWHTWTGGWEEFTPEHIGDDMFLYEGTHKGYYFSFYINGQQNLSRKCDIEFDDERDSFSRQTDFNDGYAVGIYKDGRHDYDVYYLGLINKWCTPIISDITVSGRDSDVVGMYSDGLIYCNNVFYDLDFKPVLSIEGKDWGWVYDNRSVYTPHFINGVCTMITYKNDKYWIFDIDKSGEVLTDIEEFELSELNY